MPDGEAQQVFVDGAPEQGVCHMAQRVEADVPLRDRPLIEHTRSNQLLLEATAEVVAGDKAPAALAPEDEAMLTLVRILRCQRLQCTDEPERAGDMAGDLALRCLQPCLVGIRLVDDDHVATERIDSQRPKLPAAHPRHQGEEAGEIDALLALLLGVLQKACGLLLSQDSPPLVHHIKVLQLQYYRRGELAPPLCFPKRCDHSGHDHIDGAMRNFPALHQRELPIFNHAKRYCR